MSYRIFSTQKWLYLTTVLGCIAVFLIDLDSPLGINVAVLYLAVIVGTLWIPDRIPTVVVTAVSVALTLLELNWSYPGGMPNHTIIERILSICVMLLIMGVVLYRKHVDAEWRGLVEKQRLQQKVMVELASEPEIFKGGLLQAARHVTRIIAYALDTERASVWLLNDDRTQLTCVDLYQRSTDRHETGAVLHANEYPRYFRALSGDLAVDAHDALTDPRTSEFADGYLKPLGITSMLDAAIRISGKVRGVICFEHVGRTRTWRTDEISFGAEVSDLLTQAILNDERRRAQQALKESEEKYRHLVETSHDLIWSVDKEGRWIFLNRQAARSIYGYELEEMLGRPFTDFLSPEQAQKDLAVFQQIKTGKSYFKYETIHIRKDGSPVHLLFNAITLRDDRGEVVGSTGTATDITKRVEAEQQRLLLETQLRESQKMEALGQLAGGIAHDFNNILAAMIGYAELLQNELAADPPELQRYAALILNAGTRARDLVSQILTFSRRRERIESDVALHKVVDEVINLVRLNLPPGIHITSTKFAEPIVKGDASHLYQMVMNLCTNANYAMKGMAGEISITIEELPYSEIPSKHAAHLVDGHYARLTVKDSGVGIAPQHLNHLFEPFFTTKPQGEGTGLGLAVVHGVVESHGGRIFVQSTQGKGTEFNIYLPTVGLVDVNSGVQKSVRLHGSEKILLVDDEEILAHLGREMLERYGYQVTAVTDPLEALKFLKEGRKFDLLVTDLSMANMTGEELIGSMRQVGIDIPVILCSGFRQRSGEKSALIAVSAELSKPFTTQALVGTVRRVLDQHAGIAPEESINIH